MPRRGSEGTGVVALAALAPAAMLTVDPWGWYPFGPSKWLVIPTLLLVGAAPVVLGTDQVQVQRAVGRALAALVGWMSVAAALGRDPLYAWIGTPERRFGVLTWALCALAMVVDCLDPRRQQQDRAGGRRRCGRCRHRRGRGLGHVRVAAGVVAGHAGGRLPRVGRAGGVGGARRGSPLHRSRSRTPDR